MSNRNIQCFLVLILYIIATFANAFYAVSLTVSAEPEISTEYQEKHNLPDDTVISDDSNIFYTGDTLKQDIQRSSDTPFDPFHNNMKYSSVIYNNTNGLPTSEANTIAQTNEGFIWIGSYSGLVRYDGNNFERVPLEGITGVKFLYTDSQNRLWIGATSNGIAMVEKGNIQYWNENEDYMFGSIDAIAEGSDGIVYIATNYGVVFVDRDMNIHFLDDERVNKKYICDLEQGTDGLVYGLDKDGYVFTVRDGRIQQYGYSSVTEPVCLLPDPKHYGYVYVSDEYLQVYCAFNKTNSDQMTVYNSFTNLLSYVKDIQYVDGMIWYCSGTGVYVIRPEDYKVCYDLINVPMYQSIGHVMQDYQGNFWFTSSSQGIMKIVPNFFDDLYDKYDYTEDIVNGTCIYQNVLMVATDTGIRTIDENDGAAAFVDILYDFFIEIGTVRVRSIVNDTHERLWFSTWGKGLFCLDNKKLYQYSKNTVLSSDYIRTVKETKDGSILIVGNDGLDIIKNRKVINSYGKKDGIENTDILCVEEGLNNEIFLGSDGNGIYIIGKDGSVENISKKDGLTSGVVMRIKKDRTRNIFWLVTGDSVAYMTNNHEITTVTKFPYPNNFDLYQNSKDEMWILSSNGIYVVPTVQMIENKTITPIRYGVENGLTCVTTANSFSELTKNGELYISGNTGVIKVNIENSFQDMPEIKSAIPYIDSDNKRIYPDENGNFHISSDVRKLTVYSYVFNYSLVTPQISYSLEGFDDKYITVSGNNLIPVDYTNLSGGNYRFMLKVSSSNGEEYRTVTASIIKEKAFYEQIWFYVVIVFLDLLVIFIVAQLIGVSKIKKLRQKHKEEIEKERINAELQTASKIQTGTMPDKFPPFPDRAEFDIFASTNPAKEVGGDFYDFFLTDDNHLCMVIADVSGKGVPAALFMMSAKIMISDFAEMGKSPAEIMTAVNTKICSNNPEKMFVTVWLGILEISTGRLTVANAGHEYPILMQPNGKFEIFKDYHNPMAGFIKKLKYKEYQIELQQGSKLFLYTDGVLEAIDSNEQMFGIDRLLVALNQQTNSSLEQILQNVRSNIDEFVKEAEQFDDLTMMCLEYKKV